MSLFKECMSIFPTGVTVVTTNNMCGITINSFCSLSLNPMMILFNITRTSYQLRQLSSSNDFVVNILNSEQQKVSQAFADSDRAQWQKYFDCSNNLVVVKDALCYIYCQKYKVYDGGDHKIIVGSVKDLKKNADGKPLVYYKRKYCELQT